MKTSDFILIFILVAIFLPFFLFKEAYDFLYHPETGFNTNHSVIVSFIKFAVLATIGEAIGLRIKTGKYNKPGFGLIPRAAVWGFLGITIKIAFVIFATGTPIFLEKTMEIEGAIESMKGGFSMIKLLTAFSISVGLNLAFAPVMMTFHKITDTHISKYNGRIKCLIKPIDFKNIFVNLDWKVQWNFVFKKTIPLFWIPAHTITFLMPVQFRVLFAAVLGIFLGILLAIASLKSSK